MTSKGFFFSSSSSSFSFSLLLVFLCDFFFHKKKHSESYTRTIKHFLFIGIKGKGRGCKKGVGKEFSWGLGPIKDTLRAMKKVDNVFIDGDSSVLWRHVYYRLHVNDRRYSIDGFVCIIPFSSFSFLVLS